jgi:hypothetical protein
MVADRAKSPLVFAVFTAAFVVLVFMIAWLLDDPAGLAHTAHLW